MEGAGAESEIFSKVKEQQTRVDPLERHDNTLHSEERRHAGHPRPYSRLRVMVRDLICLGY
jgi:hypothetical protein